MKKVIAVFVFMVLMGATSAYADVFALMAGQDINVGTVSVADDGTILTVTFTITSSDGWEMTATHLGVRTDNYDGIKVKPNGNVSPGKFTAGAGKTGVEHDPPETTYTYNIPLISLFPTSGLPDVSFNVDVAAHADLRLWENAGLDEEIDTEDDVYREETAWGEGIEFAVDRNWAMYFTYTVVVED